MLNRKPRRRPIADAVAPALALACLLGIGGYAMIGPTGFLAWADYRSALEGRSKELAQLKEQRDALRNRVNLLSPDNVDPDLAGELIRKELNVAAPDEVVIPLN